MRARGRSRGASDESGGLFDIIGTSVAASGADSTPEAPTERRTSPSGGQAPRQLPLDRGRQREPTRASLPASRPSTRSSKAPRQSPPRDSGPASRTLASTQRGLQQAKELAARFEAEAAQAREEVAQLEIKVDELKVELVEKGTELQLAHEQANDVAEHKGEIGASRQAIARLRRQLGKLVVSSNSHITRLQNQVQAYNRLLKEGRLEAEKFAEKASVEWDAEKSWWKARVASLKQKLDNVMLMQYEDRQQLLREHSEVVKALQVHFEEYRTTAEGLFAAEAARLEDKLAVQSRKYEAEIRLLMRSKDTHYDEVVTMKDAKLMNLIEGTDFQNVLIKHEHELEAMRRQQDEAVEEALREAWRDAQQHTEALRVALGEQESTISTLRQQLVDQAQALSETHKKVLESAERNRQLEEKHTKQLQRMRGKLETAHASADEWQQKCRQLRLEMLRKAHGGNVIALVAAPKHLSTKEMLEKAQYDAEVLHDRIGILEDRARSYEAQITVFQQRRDKDGAKIARLERELDKKAKALTDLTKTFHRFIRSRVRQYEGKGTPHGASSGPSMGEFVESRKQEAAKWRVLTPSQARATRGNHVAESEAAAQSEFATDAEAQQARVKATLPPKLLRLRAKRARASQRLAAKGKGTTGSSANLVPRRFANTPPVDVELLGQFQSVKSFEQRSAAAVRAARFKQ